MSCLLCNFRLWMLEVFPFNYPGGFVIAGVAPARWHNKIEELILYAGCFTDVFDQCAELAKISIQEAVWHHFSCNTIRNRYRIFLQLVGMKYTIPDIEQVAEISVHIQWVL